MVRINRIYTRTGDKGTTGLVDGSRVDKDSVKVEAYGCVDELNSFIGIARTLAENERLDILTDMLAAVQNELFDAGSLLASPPSPSQAPSPALPSITQENISRLEEWIDRLTDGIPDLKSFVLPGGNMLNANLHVCRAVCRRAERRVLTLSREEAVDQQIIIYLNRLSDLLFAMSRYASWQLGSQEYLWQPGKTSGTESK